MIWTDEKIEQLTELWGKGYSASQIAKMICAQSRSAVIGKVHRLGLSRAKPAKPSKPAAPPRPKRGYTHKRVPLPWTQAQQDLARTSHQSGMSDAAIAELLRGKRYTVNARQVRGKLRELFEPKRKSAPSPSADASSQDNLAARIRASHKANPAARHVTITELGANECRYPVNDPPKHGLHLFCGCETEPGQSYCAAHREFAENAAATEAANHRARSAASYFCRFDRAPASRRPSPAPVDKVL